jgi:cobalt-zinc-cadmium efflux system membrane fusion protein
MSENIKDPTANDKGSTVEVSNKVATETSVDTTTSPRPAPPRTLLIVAAVAVLLIVMLAAILLWPRRRPQVTVVEPPPTVATDKDDEHSQEGAIEVSDETAEMIGIKTEPAAKGEIEDTIATTGRVLVAPNAQAVVGAKSDGRALRVLAEPGQRVGAGQVVVVIDSPQVAELRGQLHEAQSKLRLAEQNRARTARVENRAAVIQSKNRMDLAEATLNRKRRLAELGVAAGREVAEAETEFKNAKAEYDYQSNIQTTRAQQEAASEVEQTQAAVVRITQSLSALGASGGGQSGTINVTAPIAGTVVDRHVSVGEAVTQGKELMTIMNLSNVVIEAQLPESQANRVRTGQRLIARIPGMPDHAFEGYVQSVGETVDPQKRTVGVRARVVNLGTALKHEMAVEVRVVTGGRKDALMVPAAALVEDEGIKVIYVKEGTRYERRPVTVGNLTFQWAEILSGVEQGEAVVVAGAYQLRNMQKGGSEEGGDHDDH